MTSPLILLTIEPVRVLEVLTIQLSLSPVEKRRSIALVLFSTVQVNVEEVSEGEGEEHVNCIQKSTEDILGHLVPHRCGVAQMIAMKLHVVVVDAPKSSEIR